MNLSHLKPKQIKEYLTSLNVEAFYTAWQEFIVQSEIPAGFSNLTRRAKEYERVMDMHRFDRLFGEQVAGVDEAGRGPLAGPVYAAAVIFSQGTIIEGLNDSKKLSEKKREELYIEITQKARAWSVASVDNLVIDNINIRNATFKAMAQAISGLNITPKHILIDGDSTGGIILPCTSIIKGDSKSLSIAAASIIAKVSRDRYMYEMDKIYPQYGFADHKGYGTVAHVGLLRKYGATPIHRATFIRNFV